MSMIAGLRARHGRRRWWVALSSLLGVLAVWAAPAEAAGGPTGPQPCQTPAPTTNVAPQALSGLAQLQELIENVPCAGSGQVSYATTDNLGGSMDVLDPIADPAGGYLGVYHTQFGSHAGEFRISLARSPDLIHWTRIVVLDPLGASMPTLRAVPGTGGFLLAYEKAIPNLGNIVRVRYYSSLAALQTGHFATQRDLPQTFSRFNDGTPTILSITWHHGLARSVIHIGFHYETEVRGGRGPDREAIGTHPGTARRGSRSAGASRKPWRLAPVQLRQRSMANLRGPGRIRELRHLARDPRGHLHRAALPADTELGLAGDLRVGRQPGRRGAAGARRRWTGSGRHALSVFGRFAGLAERARLLPEAVTEHRRHGRVTAGAKRIARPGR